MIQERSKPFLNVKITKRAHAFKCHSSTCNVEILNSFNPELQPKDTESAVKNKLKLLTQLRGFKFVTTLVFVFKKTESQDKTKYDNFYSSSKAETITSERDIDDVFKSIYTTVIKSIQNSSLKDSSLKVF